MFTPTRSNPGRAAVVRPVWVAVVTLPIGATILTGCAGEADPPAGGSSAAASWLMVIEATGGTYDGAAASLTLTGTDPETLAFTDRPSRWAARAGTAAFLDSWDQTFTNDPPNAAVVVTGAAPEHDMIAVELGRPTYTDQGTVTFPVTPITQAPIGVPGRSVDPNLPATFGDAAVYIDGNNFFCLNLSYCPDGQQVGAAWGRSGKEPSAKASRHPAAGRTTAGSKQRSASASPS